MLDQMTHLFRLRTIAELGSMRQAAHQLHITQPALSRSIAQLEARFGQPLLLRHSRGVELTEFGTRVLALVNRLARQWELSEAELAKSGKETTGRLKIRAGPLWRATVLPNVLSELHKTFPALVFELQNSGHGPTLDDIIEGRCDIVFGGVQIADNVDRRLTRRQFVSFYDRVVARQEHPIFAHVDARGQIPAERVLDYPWIVYTADPVYELSTIHGSVERLGRAPDIRISAESLISVIALLQSGDYLCVMPEAALERLHGPRLVPLPIELGRHRRINSGAVFREEMADWPPLVKLLDLCEQYFDRTGDLKPVPDAGRQGKITRNDSGA